MEQALEKLAELRVRARRAGVEGHRQFNPGWHLALDLRNMLLVSECVARAALERTESRGGHTREDHPTMDRKWRQHQPAVPADRPDGRLWRPPTRVRGQIDLTRETTDPIRPTCSPSSTRRSWSSTSPKRSCTSEQPTTAHFKVWRGDVRGGGLEDFKVEVNDGEVVLDIIHRLQATQAPDLAVRWNCKAGKCGSCTAEINGRPRLMCMTRMSVFDRQETITVTPLRAFPVVRDLVTDVSFNYAKAREIPSFVPPEGLGPGEYRMKQEDVDRSQEFRKCIECFLCQDTCHVVRDHEENKPAFAGPRFLMRVAELDMHPLDAASETRPGPQEDRPGRARPRLLQHHQVLHGGLPRGHQDHGQRADPAEGAGGGPQVRPAGVAGVEDQEESHVGPRAT